MVGSIELSSISFNTTKGSKCQLEKCSFITGEIKC